MKKLLAFLLGKLITLGAYVLTGVRATSVPTDLSSQNPPTLYFANHTSNADFVMVWTTLPACLRRHTRPVAAADYWNQSWIRRFVSREVFHAVLIDRAPQETGSDPVGQMAEVLSAGYSLIIFPEGKRNMENVPLLPFKSGIFRLAQQCPELQLVPVWIHNLNRVLPKGKIIPLPLACSVHYGEPLTLTAGECKEDFLARARHALLALSPEASI